MYRGLNLGATVVNKIPKSFKISSFYNPVVDICNNKGGKWNESLNINRKTSCSVYDISDNVMISIQGRDVTKILQKTLTNNIYQCYFNKTQKSLLLNKNGTILNDVLLVKYDFSSKIDTNILINKNSADYLLKSFKKVSENFTYEFSEDSIFLIQGSNSTNAIHYLTKFLKVDPDQLFYCENKNTLDLDKIKIIKYNLFTEGYIVSINKKYVNDVLYKLLNQPNIYMAGSDAYNLNSLEYKIPTKFEYKNIFSPIEISKTSLVDVKKGEFQGRDAIIDINNQFKTPKKQLYSFTIQTDKVDENNLFVSSINNRVIGKVVRLEWSPFLKVFKGFVTLHDELNSKYCKINGLTTELIKL